MKNYLFKNILSLTLFGLVFTSCSGVDIKPTPIAMDENPTQELEMMERELSAAKRNNINNLSPHWFEMANASYTTAKVQHENGESLKDIFQNLSEAHAQLDRAKKLAPLAKMVLVPVTLERDKAISAGATESTKGFKEAQEEYLELSALVESDNREEAESESVKVKELFTKVELEAITDNALDPARMELKKAKEADAKDLAPKSYSEAEKRISEARLFIKNNRYDKAKIEEYAKAALFMSQRAVAIVTEVKRTKNDSLEERVLSQEKNNQLIGSLLRLEDNRNLSFNAQSSEISQAVASLDYSISGLESDRKILVDLTQSQNYKLRSRNNKISSLEKNKKFETLLKSFNNEYKKSEAEVYRQGNNIVFRLRGINFPSGKAVIPATDYKLLQKVTGSIKKFKNPSIVIEGHSDSIGGSAYNNKLSKRRADAVGEYLVTHEAVLEDDLKMLGKGYKQPIATNKTEVGRKMNRRIDIIVKPDSI